MKQITVVVLVAWLTLLSVQPASAATPTISFKPATLNVNPGESFTVEVAIESDTPTRAVQFGVKYDPSVIQLDRVADGTFYQNWARGVGAQALTAVPFKIDNGAGQISIGGISILGGPPGSGGPTGSGPILTLHGTARSGIQGATYLAFVRLYVADGASVRMPAVLGAPGLIGVAADPTSLQPLAPLTYRPQAQVIQRSDEQGRVTNIPPTPDAIQDGNLPPPQVRFAPSGSLAVVPTATTAPSPTPVPPPTPTPVPVPVAQPTAGVPQQSTAPAVAPAAVTVLPTAVAPGPAVGVPTQPAQLPAQQPTQRPISSTGPVPGPAANNQTPGFQSLQPTQQPASQPAAVAQTVVVATVRPVTAAQPIVKPRGSTGIFLPWELIAGVGGAIAAAGIALYAIRQRASEAS